MTVWQYDCVTIWLCDNMTVWQYDCVTVTHYITLNEKTLGRGGQVGRAGGGMGDARARQGQGRGSEQRTSDRIPEYLSAENISRAPAHITRWPVSGDGRHAMMWPDQATLGLATCWLLAVCWLSVIVRGNDASKHAALELELPLSWAHYTCSTISDLFLFS